jgi:hydrogenase-4 component F
MIFPILVITPIVAAAFSFFVKKRMAALNGIAVAASVVELIACVAIAGGVLESGLLVIPGIFSVDAMGAIVLLIISAVGLIASWYSGAYLGVEIAKGVIGLGRVRQYFALLHLFLLAMFFAVLSASPIFAWVAIEATTLSTAFLVSFYNKPSGIEAAWKYLIINSVGLLLGFFGTLLFLYPALAVNHYGIATWQMLYGAVGFDPFVAKIAFVFVLIGYGTKAGLAPMHTWLPDAHSKAPVPVSALLSGVLLNVAFLTILRFKLITDAAVGNGFSSGVLIFFGTFSVVIAAFIIFIQKNYKRLLAYSSIEHMGIIALGFGFGGVGVFAAILHMIYHSLSKSLLFLSSGNIFIKYSSTKIKNIAGVASVLPVTAVLFVIGFLAITGVPPLGIFNTEFLILSSGIKAHPVVTIIVLAALALVFAGFLRHVVAMVMGKNEKNLPVGESGWGTVAPLVILAAVLIVTSLIVPSALKTLITSAASSY